MKKGQVKRKFESFGFNSSNSCDQRVQKEIVLQIQNKVQRGNDFTLKLYIG